MSTSREPTPPLGAPPAPAPRDPGTLPYGERAPRPAAARTAEPRAAARRWVPVLADGTRPGEPASAATDADQARGVELTVGWIEQVAKLTLGRDVRVKVASIGKQWRVRVTEAQLVDVLTSVASYAGATMMPGSELTIHSMSLDVSSGSGATKLGVAPGKYVFLGISHTGHADPFQEDAASSGVRPATARLGLDDAMDVVEAVGGRVTIAEGAGRGTAFNVYLPAATD